jgi:hypothetical protein
MPMSAYGMRRMFGAGGSLPKRRVTAGMSLPPGCIDIRQIEVATLIIARLPQRHLVAQPADLPRVERIGDGLSVLIDHRQAVIHHQALNDPVERFIGAQCDGDYLIGAQVKAICLLMKCHALLSFWRIRNSVMSSMLKDRFHRNRQNRRRSRCRTQRSTLVMVVQSA